MEDDHVDVDELRQQKDVPRLIEALKHPDESVRMRAAHALGEVGDEQAIPALTAALADPAATDPAEYFRGNPAWEEMGSDKPIYLVRSAARHALEDIRRRYPPIVVEPIPGEDPFQVGDIVVQTRHFKDMWGFVDTPSYGMADAKWRVKKITNREVVLELVEGIVKYPTFQRRPGYVDRVSSSEGFRAKFPGCKGNQQAFDTYRKIR
jgi:HEAT repeats